MGSNPTVTATKPCEQGSFEWGAMRTRTLTLVLTLLLTSLSGSAQAATFKDCKALNKTFRYGVQSQDHTFNIGQGPIWEPKTSASVAEANSRLDRDGDGIVCEVVMTAPKRTIKKNRSDFFSYRFSSTGQFERKGNRDSKWYATSFSSQGVSAVRKAAFASIKSYSTGLGEREQVNYLVGKNVPKSMVAAYKRQTAAAADFLPFRDLESPLQINIFTEKDLAPVEKYWAEHWFGEETIGRHKRQLSAYKNPSAQANYSVGGAAGPRHHVETNKITVGVDFYMGSRHTPQTHLLADHVPHEVAHTWQYQALGVVGERQFTNPLDIGRAVPCHLMEGGASTLGNSILMKHVDWYSDAVDVIVRRVIRDSGIRDVSEKGVLRMLKSSESWSSCESGYMVGMLAYEWLIAKFGFEKFVELHFQVRDSRTLDAAMLTLYGFDLDSFYKQSVPYIASAIKSATGK